MWTNERLAIDIEALYPSEKGTAVRDRFPDELKFVLKHLLGDDDPRLFQALLDIRDAFQGKKRLLDAEVQAGRLPGADYAERVNQLISSDLLRPTKRLLGASRYKLLMPSGATDVQLVDPAIAAKLSK